MNSGDMFQEAWGLSTITSMLCAVIATLIFLVYHRTSCADGTRHGKTQLLSPPVAPLSLPLIGHALWYKNNPVGYLAKLALNESGSSAVQGIFKVNLAGFRTTIVSSATAMKAVATASSSVLSLREAVADFGFEDALGELNVYLGTDVHRHVLKNHVYPQLSRTINNQIDAIKTAVDDHFFPSSAPCTRDVLPTMRRVFLQTSIEMFVGQTLVQRHPDFIDVYMSFQDRLEEAIAKAIVLPKSIAQNVVLSPIRSQRLQLVQMVSESIQEIWESIESNSDAAGTAGYWTAALHRMRLQDLSGWDTYASKHRKSATETQSHGTTVTASQAAEFIIGLLFAAHKNPSLGASQTLLFLLDERHVHIRAAVVHEVQASSFTSGVALSGQALLESMPCLDSCISEALRLTAHTIGGIRKVVAPNGFTFPVHAEGAHFHLHQGEYVAISHSTPHMDPHTWTNPTQFDPFGRFLKQPDVDEYKLTTFSHGMHRCPGRQLARIQMALTLAYLLRCGRFREIGTATRNSIPGNASAQFLRGDKMPYSFACDSLNILRL